MRQNNFCALYLALALAITRAGSLPLMAQRTPSAWDTNTVTLDALIAEATQNNPELRVFDAGVAGARGEVVTARTWDNPEASFAPGAVRIRESGSPSITGFHTDLGVSQKILFPGKRALQRAVAEKNLEARQLAQAAFRKQLAIQVRRAFHALLAARQVVALKEQRVTLAKSFVEAARKKVEGGFAPEFEQTKAEVEVVIAQKALREAQAHEAVARTVLNSLAGRKPEAAMNVSGTLTENVIVPDAAILIGQGLERNPSLRIQAAEVERAGLSLTLTRKSRLPDFTVGPSVEYRESEQIYGLGISLPLPFWDRKEGAIATAAAEQQRLLAEFDTLRRDIAREVHNASQLLMAAKESLAVYTPAFRAKLKSALDSAGQGYGEGRTPLLIYLETQRTYYDTEADYFETLQKLYEAQAALEAALGVPLTELQRPAGSPAEGIRRHLSP